MIKGLFRLYYLLMGFRFKEDNINMTIPEILNGTKKDISANINLLAKIYTEKTGRKVCKTCPSDVQYMILSLKNIYQMTQFKFSRHAAMYKNKKGDKTTISNGTMTDKKAIEFLKTNPKRIELFSEYPSDWKELLAGKKKEGKKEKELRLAAEAEVKIAADKAAEAEVKKDDKVSDETVKEDSGKNEDNVSPGKDSSTEAKPSRKELEKMKFKDLRVRFPKIKATSTKDFIDKVLA